jgi:hypothetical protein
MSTYSHIGYKNDGWVRFHIYPRICKKTERHLWRFKEHYYYNKSYERYKLTPDGIKAAEIKISMDNATKIGSLSNVRFIRSTGADNGSI